MSSIIGFLIMLGPLVIIHELGHYLFAKLFNVKAETFSVGFGPKLLKKKWGETEWCISAFPLGGYVKLLGEDPSVTLPPEEAARSLNAAKPWKRFFIFFGGPLFNFLLAMVLFMVILVIGEPKMASHVGRVIPGSAAEKAGFRSGDTIVSVAGASVRLLEEVYEKLQENPGKTIPIQVERPGLDAPLTLEVAVSSQMGFSQYGEEKEVGYIDGLLPHAREAIVSWSTPHSKAAKFGFQKNDKILEIENKPILNFESLEQMFPNLPSETELKITVENNGVKRTLLAKKEKSDSSLSDWGLYSSEMFIHEVVKNSPAEKAGLKAGDRVLQVGDTPVSSFYGLKDAVQKEGEKSGKVKVTWERDGVVMSEEITPTATHSRDPLLRKVTTYTVGIVPSLILQEPKMITERVLNPFKLIVMGAERMVSFSYKNFVSIKKMIFQEVSVETLGGPILIGKIAGESLSRGLIVFLSTMAVLSIGLGVLNILPIPVLDGGHLMLLSIEIIRGRPLSLRQMEVLQQVGLSLILLLMVVVIKNDLTRLPIFN